MSRPSSQTVMIGGKQTTLREAVRDLVDRGCTDPQAILASLSEQYGSVWLLRQMVNVIAMIAAGAAVDENRRAPGVHHAVSRVPGVPRVQRAAAGEDPFTGSVWVDGKGWVTLARMSASDCRVTADHYGRLAQAAERHQQWFSEAAGVIEAEGALDLGEVRDLLPTPLARLELPSAAEAAA